MISTGVEGRIPYMTYPEPWRGPPKQPPEFLRPAPKPLPSTNRYNGMTNGTRLAPQPHRPTSKYPSPPAVAPVNLTQQQQHKEDISEELSYTAYARLYHPPNFGPYPTTPAPYLYQSPYTPLLRTSYVQQQQQQQQPPPLSPLETYATPTTPTSGTYLSPQAASTFSPPSTSVKPGQSVLRERKHPSFKVPSGKEGSLKHRILTRPEDASTSSSSTLSSSNSTAPHSPLDLQRDHRKLQRQPSLLSSTSSSAPSSTSTSATSPPRSPATNKSNHHHHLNQHLNHHHHHHHHHQQQQHQSSNNNNNNNNNNVVQAKFSKGSLIQLASGDYKRIEDMRTEDFVLSAEKCEDLRLADSTVVKIVENPITGTATITLSYNQRRTQVDVESALDHPFFVYGQGWASCSKERTLQAYGLKVHTLQVGDILISLTPKEGGGGGGPETTKPPSARSETIITTATTTSMTVRPVSARDHHQHHHQQQQNHHHHQQQQQQQHLQHPHHLHLVNNLLKEQHQPSQPPPPPPLSPDRKRRWSAPDQIADGEPEARVIRMD